MEIFERKLTAIVNEEMFDFHSHEDVIVQSWNVAISDVEISNDVFLLLYRVRVDLKIRKMKHENLFEIRFNKYVHRGTHKQ